jgi:hypothetical protein
VGPAGTGWQSHRPSFSFFLCRIRKSFSGTWPGPHTNRPELVAVHGYDTKFAMHALRLGLQGVELLTTGRITLPVPEPGLSYLRSIRRGEVGLNEVSEAVASAEARLTQLRDSSSLPDEPDRDWVDKWLHRSHVEYWQA